MSGGPVPDSCIIPCRVREIAPHYYAPLIELTDRTQVKHKIIPRQALSNQIDLGEMNDADVFGKLSRIFETHAFARDGQDHELDDILEELDPIADSRAQLNRSSPGRLRKSLSTPTIVTDKPTPYEVWSEKQRSKQFTARQQPKLNSEQWDRLVEKMHQSNRVKQSAMIREQNLGLASELGGYLFRPRINRKSLELSATMKSLQSRLPEMISERDREMKHKRKEAEENAVAGCTFAPQRQGEKTSSKYLAKMGRKKLRPDDLIAYAAEKERRTELRKQILTEVADKECTFKPQLGERSTQIHSQLLAKGALAIHPVTKTALSSPTKASMNNTAGENLGLGKDAVLEEGPVLCIESEHPYRNNTQEFTTVAVPGAVRYIISFSTETRTEPVYDYVKFFDDDTHTQYFGAGKYSGGAGGTPCNWPGQTESRPPLVIEAPRFVIAFKTNGSVNDWGFRMMVKPILMVNTNTSGNNGGLFEVISTHSPMIPNISDAARNYKHKEPVHQRLYKHAIAKHDSVQTMMVEQMQNKLNISLKPWELARNNSTGAADMAATGGAGQSLSPSGAAGTGTGSHSYHKKYNKTHLAKATLNDFIDEMVIGEANAGTKTLRRNQSEIMDEDGEDEGMETAVTRSGPVHVSVVEYDESLSTLWRSLRSR